MLGWLFRRGKREPGEGKGRAANSAKQAEALSDQYKTFSGPIRPDNTEGDVIESGPKVKAGELMLVGDCSQPAQNGQPAACEWLVMQADQNGRSRNVIFF